MKRVGYCGPEQDFALLGQRQATGVAMEQIYTHFFFQGGNLATDCRLA